MAQSGIQLVSGHGGAPIAVHRLGEGSPVVMIHGLASSAEINWLKYGHAKTIAAAGFEAVMLDLRAHGESVKSHDPAAYPQDVALLDIEAVLGALDLGRFDLVGYSLGSRLSVQLVARGLAPKRLVLGGMGYETLTNWAARRDHFLVMLDRFNVSKLGDNDFLAIQFMKNTGVDPVAMKLLLRSTGDIADAMLDTIAMPTLVVAGEDDGDVGSPARLAQRLPDARLRMVPGNHMSAVTKPDLGQAIVDYLAT
ncbi:MAG: alpha/beta fold hydrolase [Sphingobium sp.]|nr:alpha/beta fold hydrolase [Sphingobium sp.]